MEQKEKFNPFVYIKGIPRRGKEVIAELLKKSGYPENLTCLYLPRPLFGSNPFKIYYIGPFGDEIRETRLSDLSAAQLDFLNSHYTEIFLSKPILDEKEREYLSAVIRPWRDSVESITKQIVNYTVNCIPTKNYSLKIRIKNDYMTWLPSFKGGMYEGMETNREYTLKELNLQ